MGAFGWEVIGSVAGVVAAVAAIVFGVIPVIQERRVARQRNGSNAGGASSSVQQVETSAERLEAPPALRPDRRVVVGENPQARSAFQLPTDLAARPDSLPRVWNIPARNPGFVGRAELLVAVRERLVAGGRTVVQTLHGMGGVGKTQLAVEYAYQFAGTYDLAWWVNSEQIELIGDQFAALGTALGCIGPGIGIDVVRSAVLAELRERGRWLLVFDNAENPDALRQWLPGGYGHVLITSRASGWVEVAVPLQIDVLARPESITMLRARVDGLSEFDADRLASHLGDLPLAIAQAAGLIAATGLAANEYVRLLETRAAEILDEARPVSYPLSLSAAIQLTVDQLTNDAPAAAELAYLCAFFAPEPVPDSLFVAAVDVLPEPLASRAADPLPWRQTIADLTTRAVVRIDQHGLQMHRLTQAVLRDRLTDEHAAAFRVITERILAANRPADSDPASWPEWVRLMPHLLVADLETTVNQGLQELAKAACAYLVVRGLTRAGLDLTTRLYQSWRQHLGDDDLRTMLIAYYLAWALRHVYRYEEARDLDQDTFDRCRRIRGEDDDFTLSCANHLAMDMCYLGELEAARDLHQAILDRRRRKLGDDDDGTLSVALNLAMDLRALGEFEGARELDQDARTRFHRRLGEDHPDTLEATNSLAEDLRGLGEFQAAREFDQDTLTRRRRILGDDNRLTLISASHLAADLRALGDLRGARELDEDTLRRRQRTLGEEHPDTRQSASSLAADQQTPDFQGGHSPGGSGSA